MKYWYLFKKEIKTKWSTRLFIMVLTLIVCTMYASNIQLKHHYDSTKHAPKNRFKGLKKVVDTPFKHIKIENCVYREIKFDTTSQQQGVFISDYDEALTQWTKDIVVKNDTLFLKNLDIYANDYNSHRFPVHIFMPQIESITLINGNFFVGTLQQKSLTINLFDKSRIVLSNKMSDLDSCKLSMSGKSVMDTKQLNDSKKVLNIRTLEAEMQDGCTFNSGNINIDNFKLKTTGWNKIELSSNTLNRLMKK